MSVSSYQELADIIAEWMNCDNEVPILSHMTDEENISMAIHPTEDKHEDSDGDSEHTKSGTLTPSPCLLPVHDATEPHFILDDPPCTSTPTPI